MKRLTACERNPELVRRMVAEGAMLKDIAAAVGTNRTRVREYVEREGIPHLNWRRAGHSRERNGRWTGGRIIDDDGYVLLKMRSHPHCDRHGYVREHRLVMEAILKRYLLPSEVVHHKDEDKQNNHPDNLGLYPHNSEHLRETLRGKIPKWTPDGYDRILKGVERAARNRRQASRSR